MISLQTRPAAGRVLALAMILTAGLSSHSTSAQGPDRVDVIIAFQSPPGPAEEALVRAHAGAIKHTYRIVPAMAANVPAAALAGLTANPRVRRVEPDGVVYALGAVEEQELNNTWGVRRIGAGTVHTSANLGTAVRVAVIDSGVDCTHPELWRICMGGYDFVNNRPLSGSTNADDNGHGTHVAGTVAAARGDGGVVGVAPQVGLYDLKVLNANGSGAWSGVIAALDWASDKGIQITNNSYGSGTNPGLTVREAFDASAAVLPHGILHVAAAGNSGNCAGRGDNVGYPAQYSSVMAVAATNSSDGRPCFSSTGPAVEIAAPGASINSTKTGGGYVVYSGTSMASPHVAGVAALVIQALGSRPAAEIRERLTSTAEDKGPAGRDPQYGWGLVIASAAVGSSSPPANDSGEGGGGNTGSGENNEGGGGTTDPLCATALCASVGYSSSGGKDGKKDLVITVTLRRSNDGTGSAGTAVTVRVDRDGSTYGTASGTTDSNGIVAFKANNAPSGTYTTTVTSPGDVTTEANSHVR